jgi:hypothetical protein
VTDIQQPRFSDGLRRLLGVRPGPVGAEVADELVPTLGLVDSELLELRALLGLRSWTIWQSLNAGGAGVRSEGAVYNLLASQLLVVIEGFELIDNGGGLVTFYINRLLPANFASAAIPPRYRDTRFMDSGAATGRRPNVSSQVKTTGAASVTSAIVYQTPAESPIEFPIVLSPGYALVAQPPTDNTTFAIQWWGYERVVLPDELSIG